MLIPILLFLAPAVAKASSILFTGGSIVAFEVVNKIDTLKVIHNGSVLVTDGRIVNVGSVSPGQLPNDTERIDITGKIMTPGFIDTHRKWSRLSISTNSLLVLKGQKLIS
jgi:imidazolonepropionase-like amidohydrolase